MPLHYSRGNRDSIAFVFSCPGKKEKDAGHPAAGITGRNLELLLLLLAKRLNMKNIMRDDVTIANAWDHVEYRAQDTRKRSEATEVEIRDADNIQRLAAELQHVTDLIIFCGDKAKTAAQELRPKHFIVKPPAFEFIGHLGTLGLNIIKQDVNGIAITKPKKEKGQSAIYRQAQSENTRLRLEVVVAKLPASIAAPSATVDMNGEFYHVCDRVYLSGDCKPAGTYGKAVSEASDDETLADLHGEHLREKVRQEHFRDRPSRFASTFVFETLQDALDFRQKFGRKSAVYKVRFVHQGAAAHKVCMTAFRLPTSSLEPPAEMMANNFWRNPPVYSCGNEVFAESDIQIIAECEPPVQ